MVVVGEPMPNRPGDVKVSVGSNAEAIRESYREYRHAFGE